MRIAEARVARASATACGQRGFAPRALVRDVSAATPANLGWMVYLGVFPTSVAFTTGLTRSHAARPAG